ncbi:MAG TPA: M28 family peptidase [Solirubrobacterales bacterium]|jgi:peptidase M28-like protein|nr:M28 family peptidase [Solirubrobacterales bacterium]
MIDLRLYRYALLAVPLVFVIAMFSLQDVPRSLSAGIPPDAFDPASAVPLAKQLGADAPYPTPGSAADEKLAEQVKSHFAAIDEATVSEQTFDGSFRGHDVHLRNLIATLPGDSNRQIALIAPRDVAQGSGATTTAAATAALLEIAEAFSGTAHHKTLVFVSVDGSSIGALGTKRFIRDYSDSSLLDAAIVLSQPALSDPTAPLVIPWSTGPQSTASQLAETADSITSNELATPAGDEGPLDDLFRLAAPAGLGDQAPLIEHGLPAVRLSADGELPVDPGSDTPEAFDNDSFDRFGRAALSLILTLDDAPGAVEHGPQGYIGLAGNLMPGWTLALLALSLLVPAGLAAGSGLVSAAHSPIEAIRGFVWTLLRSLPFLGALAVVLLTTLVGLLPSPDFPFDPRIEGLGTGGTVSVVLAVLLYCASAFFLRPLRPPPSRAVATAAPAALMIACLATLGIWIVNPYLGLVVSIGLQAWVLAAARLARGRGPAVGFVLLGLVPALVLLADLAGRFDAGLGVWRDVVLMVADGQIGATLTVLACLLAGSGVAIVALAGRTPRTPSRPAPEMRIEGEISVRRQAPEPEPPEPGPEAEAEEEREAEPEEEPERPQPEPERDPRLWSNPRGSSSPPSGRLRVTPWPSVT